ncbi:MAG: NTPase [Candidatus Latescibacteria bacterium]|nr:NTPase [Candidatus Latescibacterota bacterium]NIO28419.1 NTPase [Candidatus Latescibacterota bacterium]NIO55968.1 NTPase [Candidatus Latescibacterota bacterium]NIT01932.1 NTPase [Candidatus Latescibacterota bacterium]
MHRNAEVKLEKKNILITGLPGVGKTTLIRRLSDELMQFHPVGFYTAEIRKGGVRKGFDLICFDGRRGILSHVDIRSSFKVGRYGVDVAGFEDFLESIPFRDPAAQLIVIDEIGKMECYSKRFKILLEDILNSQKTIIATIARKGGGIIAEVKKRPDVVMFEISRGNRDTILSEILATALRKD